MAERNAVSSPSDENSPASRGFVAAQVKGLAVRLDTSVKGMNDKIDASIRGLNDKSDASTQRLDAKIDAVVQRLDEKIEPSIRRLAIELVKTQADVRDIKETMATKDDVRQVLSTITAFAGKYQSHDDAMTLHGHAITEMSIALKNHEQRIARLEGPGTSP